MLKFEVEGWFSKRSDKLELQIEVKESSFKREDDLWEAYTLESSYYFGISRRRKFSNNLLFI